MRLDFGLNRFLKINRFLLELVTYGGLIYCEINAILHKRKGGEE